MLDGVSPVLILLNRMAERKASVTVVPELNSGTDAVNGRIGLLCVAQNYQF